MKKVKGITVNTTDKLVTVVTSKLAAEEVTVELSNGQQAVVGIQIKEKVEPVIVKCADGDEFDKYIGVALGLAYAQFGSRRKFVEWVDKLAVVKTPKKSIKDRTKKDKKEGK